MWECEGAVSMETSREVSISFTNCGPRLLLLGRVGVGGGWETGTREGSWEGSGQLL